MRIFVNTNQLIIKARTVSRRLMQTEPDTARRLTNLVDQMLRINLEILRIRRKLAWTGLCK